MFPSHDRGQWDGETDDDGEFHAWDGPINELHTRAKVFIAVSPNGIDFGPFIETCVLTGITSQFIKVRFECTSDDETVYEVRLRQLDTCADQ